jgi:CRISPR system Cascade subunit CasD
MVAGILGAALGYRRWDRRLSELASGISYGVVVHSAGVPVMDFQTADLTRVGKSTVTVDESGFISIYTREGSSEALGRQMARRPLIADADMSVVVSLPSGWDASDVLAALEKPVFPLYLGRMSCFPSLPVGERVIDCDSIPAGIDVVASERPGIRYTPGGGSARTVVSVPGRGCPVRLFAVG